mgnify:CR=1 FL=1
MNIFDIENAVMPVILKRGQDYFRKEKVDQLMQVGPGEYVLEIEGTHIYEVFVEIDNHFNIVMSDCTCPYDMGPHCKHEVAAYLAIRKQLEDEQLSLEELEVRLAEMEKDELIMLLKELMDDDRSTQMKLTKMLNNAEDDEWIEQDDEASFETFNVIEDEQEKVIDELSETNLPATMTDQELIEALKKYPVSFAKVFFPSAENLEEGTLEGRNIELEKLGLKFQIMSGYIHFLSYLASYYRKDEWSAVIRDIAKQIKEQKGIDFLGYEQLLQTEGLEDELLKYCQQKNEAIVLYHDLLIDLYPEEVELIFRQLILDKASIAKNRSQYHHVCELIRHMAFACDSEGPYDLVDELIELYPRKRLFVEMLQEI